LRMENCDENTGKKGGEKWELLVVERDERSGLTKCSVGGR